MASDPPHTPSAVLFPGALSGTRRPTVAWQSKSPAVAAHGDEDLIRENCQNRVLNGVDAGSACC
jgi:hypothetical protein